MLLVVVLLVVLLVVMQPWRAVVLDKLLQQPSAVVVQEAPPQPSVLVVVEAPPQPSVLVLGQPGSVASTAHNCPTASYIPAPVRQVLQVVAGTDSDSPLLSAQYSGHDSRSAGLRFRQR